MSLQSVLAAAKADLGYTEYPPNSNRTKYGEWYGMNGQPWCVMALAYWFDKAGEAAAFCGGGRTASCGTLLRWYFEQGLTAPKEKVQKGDIVLMNFRGGAAPEHCGLVYEVSDGGNVRIQTVEGNTTPGSEGSQDNGGCVAQKTRSLSQVVGVCRPQYKPEDTAADDVAGHWAEEDIRWCMEKGLFRGYPDGRFQPDRGVTRAELAVILRRREEMI